jgi:hypothetical protein
MKWKYSSENIGGNFHDVVEYVNKHHPEWDIVAMSVAGNYTVVVYRVPMKEEV